MAEVVAAVVSAAAGSISAGTSVAGVAASFGSWPHNVKFQLELNNYSNSQLIPYQNKIHTGQTPNPPEFVNPGEKQSMGGHKTSNAATGCIGTAAWTISGTMKMLVIMYSVPYSHDYYANWLGVTVTDKEDTSDYYNKMYYNSQTFFKRKEFYYDTDPVTYTGDNEFAISGTMGTTHKPTIKVHLVPKNKKNLANRLKSQNINFKG